MSCNHEWVDVGFNHTKEVCKHCDLLKSDCLKQQSEGVKFQTASEMCEAIRLYHASLRPQSTPPVSTLPNTNPALTAPFKSGDWVTYTYPQGLQYTFFVTHCQYDPFTKEWHVRDNIGTTYAAKYCTLCQTLSGQTPPCNNSTP